MFNGSTFNVKHRSAAVVRGSAGRSMHNGAGAETPDKFSTRRRSFSFPLSNFILR
jgi:hypothetical protein